MFDPTTAAAVAEVQAWVDAHDRYERGRSGSEWRHRRLVVFVLAGAALVWRVAALLDQNAAGQIDVLTLVVALALAALTAGAFVGWLVKLGQRRPAMPSAPQAPPGPVPRSVLVLLPELGHPGKDVRTDKIELIKRLRAVLPRIGLKRAKDVVDSLTPR